MSAIDIILIVALAAFTVSGFTKGLVAKILSLAALVVGIIVSAKYGKVVANFLVHFTGFSETVCGVIGVVVIFVVLFAVAGILSKGFRKIPIFRIWDKFGGAVFGLLEGALLLSLLLLFLQIFNIPAEGPTLKKSFMYDPLKGFAPNVYEMFVSNKSSERYIDKFFSLPPKPSSHQQE